MHARSLNSVAITPNLLTWLPSERKQNVMFSRVKWPTLAPRVSLCPHIKALHSYISLQSFKHKSLYPLIFWYRHLAYLSFSNAESVLQNGIIDVCWTKVSQIKLNYWDHQSHVFFTIQCILSLFLKGLFGTSYVQRMDRKEIKGEASIKDLALVAKNKEVAAKVDNPIWPRSPTPITTELPKPILLTGPSCAFFQPLLCFFSRISAEVFQKRYPLLSVCVHRECIASQRQCCSGPNFHSGCTN